MSIKNTIATETKINIESDEEDYENIIDSYTVIDMIQEGSFLEYLAHNECVCDTHLFNDDYFGVVLELIDEDIVCGLINIEALDVIQIAIFLNLIKHKRKKLIETKISDSIVDRYITKALVILGDLELYSYFVENIYKSHLNAAKFFKHKTLIKYIKKKKQFTENKTDDVTQLIGKFKFDSIVDLCDPIEIMSCCVEEDFGDKFLLSGLLSRIILYPDLTRQPQVSNCVGIDSKHNMKK